MIFALSPGQETSNSLVDILYGDASPSGRLPFTVAKAESDYGPLLNSTISSGPFPESNFTESLYIDYRYFEQHNATPQYEFGYGLSYSAFSYAKLAIESLGGDIAECPSDNGTVPQGGPAALWDTLFNVTVSIINTGGVEAAEVPQLYLRVPTAPARQLRGFDRVHIPCNETVHVIFPLTRRDLSIWDVVAQKWKVQSGEYPVYVGASSRDIRLTGRIEV